MARTRRESLPNGLGNCVQLGFSFMQHGEDAGLDCSDTDRTHCREIPSHSCQRVKRAALLLSLSERATVEWLAGWRARRAVGHATVCRTEPSQSTLHTCTNRRISEVATSAARVTNRHPLHTGKVMVTDAPVRERDAGNWLKPVTRAEQDEHKGIEPICLTNASALTTVASNCPLAGLNELRRGH